MSAIFVLGVSHRTAALALREQLALTEGRAAGVLNALTSEETVSEAAALSTCNRTELYLVVGDPVDAEAAALGVLAREAGIRPTELLGPLYSLRSSEAAAHLYRVTAGLDSMILGEAEIQGQVKRAYQLALVLSAVAAARALGLQPAGLTALLAFFPAVRVLDVSSDAGDTARRRA